MSSCRTSAAARSAAERMSSSSSAGVGVAVERAAEQVGVAADDGEQVVEVVGDPAGEPADRFHLLRLPELFLEPLAVGDVLVDAEHADDLAARVAQRHLARQEGRDDAARAASASPRG